MSNPISTTNKADLEVINGQPMMGSKAISSMTGKDHSSIVVRDIKNMLNQLGIYPANPQDTENQSFFFKMKAHNGRQVVDQIFLDQDLSTTLVTGYSVHDRYKIIKRWGELESGKVMPLVATQAPDMISLARVVAEATASATLKAVMDCANPHASLSKGSHNSASEAKPLSSPLDGVFNDIHEWFAHNPDSQAAPVANELVPVHKVSWETGLSDASCRRLVTFANLPTGYIEGVRGICVKREAFISAFQVLLEDSSPPSGKRKRWQHPEFGGFELRKPFGTQEAWAGHDEK
ncbi:hypothetical protein [Erwinia aphidicola]|uniref:hypothetical protein n=1 Tax=Erwinia aphidicola TaxID=68334 RepID=UPI00300DB59A